jgi:hypothetical protein
LEERKTDGSILALTVCSDIGLYRINYLRGCNSGTLKIETTSLSEMLVKPKIVLGVKLQEIFSDRYLTGEPENLITWLKFLSDILL